MKTLYFVDGGKGGLGKSILAFSLLDYFGLSQNTCANRTFARMKTSLSFTPSKS